MENKDALTRKFGLKNLTSAGKIFLAKKDRDLFRLSGIFCWTGSQGSGKTLGLMSALLDIKKRYPKVKIFSNIHLNGIDYVPFTGPENFTDEESNGTLGTVYVIDEIHTLWSSLESKNMNGNLLTIWCQNRKNKRLILCTSQRFTRVAKPIREQVTFNIECKKPIFRIFFRYRYIDASYYDDNGKLVVPEGEEVITKWKTYIPSLSALNVYDTYEVVKK